MSKEDDAEKVKETQLLGAYMNLDVSDEHLDSAMQTGIEYFQYYCQKYGVLSTIESFKKVIGVSAYDWHWFAMAGYTEVEKELRACIQDDQVDPSERFYAIIGLAYLGYAEAFDEIEKALIQDQEEKTEYFQHLKRMNQDRAKSLLKNFSVK